MHSMRFIACAALTLALGHAVGVGQGSLGPATNNKPPTDSVKVFPSADLRSMIDGDHAGRLLEGDDLFSLNLLHRKVEPATVHGDVVDLYWIQEGSATLE